MTGADVAQPLIFQPMWITVTVQILTLLVAAGVSYGMTRAKLSSNEKEITALRKEVTQLQLDFQKWQRERLNTVITHNNCKDMQATCRESLCRKVDNLSIKLDSYTHAAQANWQNLAMVIGAICQKLEIDPPDLK